MPKSPMPESPRSEAAEPATWDIWTGQPVVEAPPMPMTPKPFKNRKKGKKVPFADEAVMEPSVPDPSPQWGLYEV